MSSRRFPRHLRIRHSRIKRGEKGAAILEFAIVLPLLVVFVVGIYDFSGAFNQKQKIAQAAQEGAILTGAQPTNDIATTNGNPESLQPVVTAILNSLTGSGVIAKGACTAPGHRNGSGRPQVDVHNRELPRQSDHHDRSRMGRRRGSAGGGWHGRDGLLSLSLPVQ